MKFDTAIPRFYSYDDNNDSSESHEVVRVDALTRDECVADRAGTETASSSGNGTVWFSFDDASSCFPAVYHYGQRFYSPNQSRWLSRDPVGERGDAAGSDLLHVYRAFSNNPITLFDAIGLCTRSQLGDTQYTPGGTAACIKRVPKTIWITPCHGCRSYAVTVRVIEIGWQICDLLEICLCPPDWTVLAKANCGPCH